VHVFSEKDPEALHSRHPFITSADSCRTESGEVKEGALDVCAMDCEMVYTTAGMSVARVSVVDGKGDQVFDEHVRMSDGVKVLYVIWSHFALLVR
jgi:RNA exonuclease 1